jgi:hypothetical protein
MTCSSTFLRLLGLALPAPHHSEERTGSQQQQQQRSLLEQQVVRMRQEIAHPAGVRLILRYLVHSGNQCWGSLTL